MIELYERSQFGKSARRDLLILQLIFASL